METIALPAPRGTGWVSVEEALATRRSVRRFDAAPLPADTVGQLLWAAQGVTASEGYRAAPSAGALYPLEVYAATAAGTYRYLPHGHLVAVLGRRDLRPGLAEAALDQEMVLEAPLVIVIAAVYARSEGKYRERARRYTVLEAGHAAQNVLLQAAAAGLAGVPIGAFDDARVAELLGLPSDQAPLYLIPLGRPRR